MPTTAVQRTDRPARSTSMSKHKKKLTATEPSKREQMVDAILGFDEEMSCEMAREILGSYGLNEIDLLDDFKGSVREHLKMIPAEGDESKRLGGMLRNIADFQKEVSGVNLSPRDRISQIFSRIARPLNTQPTYSFRNREEGELPDSDQAILDALRDELQEEE